MSKTRVLGLVNHLLNDVGDNPDQLPILQHALMRTWDKWKEDHQGNEAIDLRHYEAIGGLSEAFSRHADEAFKELSEERQKLAEQMFKCLTEKGPDNREIRRPLTVREICAVTGAEASEVMAVIDVFRRPGCSFVLAGYAYWWANKAEEQEKTARQLSSGARHPQRPHQRCLVGRLCPGR